MVLFQCKERQSKITNKTESMQSFKTKKFVWKRNTPLTQGMQPYVFSRQAHNLTGREWIQNGVNLGMAKQELRYEYLEEKLTKYSYHCLELEYEFEY